MQKNDWGSDMKQPFILTATALFVGYCSVLADQPKLDYSASVTGNFDSNIGQNIMNQSKLFVAPALGAKWFPAHGPVFGRIDMSYQLHVQDRAPKYNDPLIDAGVGAELKSGKFRISPELSYGLWFANDVTIKGDSTAKNFQLVLREISLKTPMKLVYPKQLIELGVGGSFTDDIGSDYDGISVAVDPSWSYRFKKKRNATVQMKSFGLGSSIDLNLVKGKTKQYFQGEIAPEVAVRLGKKGGYVSLGGYYTRRSYFNPTSNPQGTDSLKELLTVTGGSGFIDIPIVADLHIQAGGKLRFRDCNISYDEWNRHNAYIRLKWDSSLGRDSE